jgi:CheY-like chemotaxis protein
MMEGSVAVESEPGHGSAFTVNLALRMAPAGSPLIGLVRPWMAVTLTRDSEPHDARKVLVVDDHPVNREVLMRQLAILGIDADSAVDGEDALAKWSIGDYALVLADIHMPQIDGYELTRRIRAIESEHGSPRLPIVAVTANVMKGEEQRCLALGMDAYLSKPISVDRLKSTLERWLSIRTEEPDDLSCASAPSIALDRSVLRSWLGDQPEAVRSLMEKFRDTAIDAEREIGAQAIGAVAVGERAQTLEQGGKAGDWSICRGELGPLAKDMRRVIAEIESDDGA